MRRGRYVDPIFGFITERKPPEDPSYRPARVYTTRPHFLGSGGVEPETIEMGGAASVRKVALIVREVLSDHGLVGFPKTSGSRGIHVQVPIARRHSFAIVREFAGIVAGALARAHPGLVTTEWAKEKRRGVLVDANQNGPGKTNAAVYSVRPRAGASVSTPLRWEEVASGLDPSTFTMDVVLDRVARDGDLFAGVLGGKQSLTRALRALR